MTDTLNVGDRVKHTNGSTGTVTQDSPTGWYIRWDDGTLEHWSPAGLRGNVTVIDHPGESPKEYMDRIVGDEWRSDEEADALKAAINPPEDELLLPTELLDYATAWVDSYIQDENVNLPEGVRDKDIRKLHDMLSAAVVMFMADAEITNPDWRTDDDG